MMRTRVLIALMGIGLISLFLRNEYFLAKHELLMELMVKSISLNADFVEQGAQALGYSELEGLKQRNRQQNEIAHNLMAESRGFEMHTRLLVGGIILLLCFAYFLVGKRESHHV